MFNLAEYVEKRVQYKLKEHLFNTIASIENVAHEKGLFNYQCFDNAVDYATRNGCEVIMGITVRNGGGPVLHFWCKDSEGHREVSTGYHAKSTVYYALINVQIRDWDQIGSVFLDGITHWRFHSANAFQYLILRLSGRRVV